MTIELSKEVKEELGRLDPAKKKQVEARIEHALKIGNTQCSDCGRVTGIWRIMLYTVRNAETGESKNVCQRCLLKLNSYDGVGITWIPGKKKKR